MISTEIYNEPINVENPTGSNVEYDEDYQKLLVMLQEKPEQQFGDLIIEAQRPDWEKIHKICGEIILNKSKDLNVMSYYTQSSIACFGLKGLSGGLQIILNNLNTYWDDVHPKLYDEDNEYDPEYRLNSLSLFNSLEGIVREVKNSFIIKNGLSQAYFTVKEVEGFLDNSNVVADSYPGGVERLLVDMQVALEQSESSMNAILDSLQSIDKIKKIFFRHIPDYEIKFDHLEKTLIKFQKQVRNPVSSVEHNHEETEQSTTIDSKNNVPIQQVLNWSNYSISTRHDVDLLLEKIYLYFERYEPSHPAPLFIRRIQKLMNYNFYEIIKDINPESLSILESLVGQPFDNNIEN